MTDENKTATQIMLEQQEAPRRLVSALITTPEQRTLYLDNAWFKLSIEELARFLPFLVSGLAATSEAEGERMARILEAMKHVTKGEA